MANYSFILPVNRNTRISSYYGDRMDPLQYTPSTHYGLDFACPVGSNVYAAADGEIIWVGHSATYGNAIVIEHQGGYLTLSAHLSEIKVRSGDYVHQCQTIGLSGRTGARVKGPHLHFETIDGNATYKNNPIKDLIRKNNGNLGNDGYNHLGVPGTVGRYDMYTGKLLANSNDNGSVNRAVAGDEQLDICKTRYTRETLPTKHYIWHTCGDGKVRSSHAELDGTMHSVDENIFPGEEYGCRCWAEEAEDENVKE